MEALTVDFDLIAQSMRDLYRETNEYFLDRRTGRVINLPRRLIRCLVDDERSAIPDWDARHVPQAREILFSSSGRYLRIPEAYGQPTHAWMSAFTKTVRSSKLRHKLMPALRGRGVCKRFREILSEDPEEMRRWAVFHNQCWKEKIERWLEEAGILAVNNNPKSLGAIPHH